MRFLIVGGGGPGVALANALAEMHHSVTVIELDARRVASVHVALSNHREVRILTGDGTHGRMLEEAGIRNTDVVIAVADRDSVNSLVAQKVRVVYGVNKVIAAVRNEHMSGVLESCGVIAVNIVKPAVTSILDVIYKPDEEKSAEE